MLHSMLAQCMPRLALTLGLSFAACLTGCASNRANSPNYDAQAVFDRPEDAAKQFAQAVNSANSAAELESIFGTEARATLSGGDPIADRRNREVIAAAVNEKWSLNSIDSDTRELVIGNENWPFPIPLVRDARGWWFDTAAGREEVLARRIGRNELSTIGTLRAYVAAQAEYAAAGRDGKPAGVYAQQIRSDAGMQNGLYWPTAGTRQKPSPFGEFVATASTEGYGVQGKDGTAPYHGYFFRILKKQGSAAPGGAADYVVNGNMTGGFAMIAYPAEYMNSGVMSFIVGKDGVVYESDLGADTAKTAAAIDAYDPASGWQRVE